VIRSLDWQTDLALFKSAVEVAPDNPRARVSLGKEYVLKEDLEAARNQALTALEHDKDHTQAHSLLGRIYWEEGNNGAAAQEFKVVLEDIPHDNYANNALGTIYREQGRLEEALALFEAASNRQPIIWRTLNNAGSVLLELGKPEEARMYFSRALEVRPDSREAAYNMGVALTSLGRSAEAIVFLEGWMSSHSLDSQMLTLMGLTYASENKIDASVDAFRRALEIDPENALAATRLVDYHMSNGEYKDAVVLLKNLVTGNPDSVRERMMYAVALEQTGKLDKAVEQLRAADRLKPNDATIRRMLANTLSKLKEADEASP
jgi:Tfp pilus assembly protein PilF